MRYIDSWLTGLGLEYITPKLKENGITTPKKLATLSLRDMYTVVGVEDAEDRKKLYFLIQRLNTILNSKADGASQSTDGGEDDVDDGGVKVESSRRVKSGIPTGKQSVHNRSASLDRSTDEQDLRALRKSRRNSTESATPVTTSSSHAQERDQDYGDRSHSAERISVSGSASGSASASKNSREKASGLPTASSAGNVMSPTARKHASARSPARSGGGGGAGNIPNQRNSARAALVDEEPDVSVSRSPSRSRRETNTSIPNPSSSSSSSSNAAQGGGGGKGGGSGAVGRAKSMRFNAQEVAAAQEQQRLQQSRRVLSADDYDNEYNDADGNLSQRYHDRHTSQQERAGGERGLGEGEAGSIINSGSGRDRNSMLPPRSRTNRPFAVPEPPRSLSPPPSPAPPPPTSSSSSVRGTSRQQQQQQQGGYEYDQGVGGYGARPGSSRAGASRLSSRRAADPPPADDLEDFDDYDDNNNSNVRQQQQQQQRIGSRGGEGGRRVDPYGEDEYGDFGAEPQQRRGENNTRSSQQRGGGSGSARSGRERGGDRDRERDDFEDDDGIMDMAIRVVVRKRPISKSELNRGDRDVMEIEPGGHVLVHEPKTKVDLTKVVETTPFTFDDAFEENETNEVIYSRTIKTLVKFVFEGGMASCFAYGQTGSGKTFSMMGSRPDAPALATVNAGLYVLAARDIFKYNNRPEFQGLKVYVSCFEIYGGKLFDLLNDRGVVKCLEDSKQRVQLPGLTEHAVHSVEELLELMGMAHNQRSTGSTGANAESSRSHQVMQLVFRQTTELSGAKAVEAARAAKYGLKKKPVDAKGKMHGKLSFIDLAGSERGADTTHNSKQTRMEGAEINTSLLALKEVIRSLERKHGHTPFRGSKLTQVLKDSFVGEKTRTCMIACVSPSHSNCEHTLNTLRYADRVKEHSSGGGGDGSAKVGSSNYDSLAYDGGAAKNARPRTASASPGRRELHHQQQQQQQQQQNAPLSRPVSLARMPSARPITAEGAGGDDASTGGRGGGTVDRKNKASSLDMRRQQQDGGPSTQQPRGVRGGGAGGGRRGGRGGIAQDDFGDIDDEEDIEDMQEEGEEEEVDEYVEDARSARRGGIRLTSDSRTPPHGRPPPQHQRARSEDRYGHGGFRGNRSYEDESPGYDDGDRYGRNNNNSAAAGAGGGGSRRGVGRDRGDQNRGKGSGFDGNGSHDGRDFEVEEEDFDEQLLLERLEIDNENKRSAAGSGNNRKRAAAGPAPSVPAVPVPSAGRGARVNSASSSNNSNSRDGRLLRPSKFVQEEEEEEAFNGNGRFGAEDEEEELGEESDLDGTELIQRTMSLLSAHKQSIAEMVEVMKEEMELVQEMENVDDRNSELYIDRLQSILDVKDEAVGTLRDELYSFQLYRGTTVEEVAGEEEDEGDVGIGDGNFGVDSYEEEIPPSLPSSSVRGGQRGSARNVNSAAGSGAPRSNGYNNNSNNNNMNSRRGAR